STSLGRGSLPAPERLGPEDVGFLLEALASAASKIAVFPMQDLLAMSEAFRPADPAAERINVPGTDNPWNWGWRLPATIEALMADPGLARSAALVAAKRAGKKAG
ncbi:MAG TPA: 4-alpha-glucanotransferase, partial [Rectinemataceae bacterium]|nr:4-alpha-glucanotransferase [Rectinemataceae bacterium]